MSDQVCPYCLTVHADGSDCVADVCARAHLIVPLRMMVVSADHALEGRYDGTPWSEAYLRQCLAEIRILAAETLARVEPPGLLEPLYVPPRMQAILRDALAPAGHTPEGEPIDA